MGLLPTIFDPLNRPKEVLVKADRYSSLKAPVCIGLCLMAAALGLRAESPAPAKQGAVTALEQDVATYPNNPELWLHLGFAYRKMGEIDKAQTAFEKAAALDSRNPDALYMLGLIYEKKNMKQDAIRVWKQYAASEKDASRRAEAENHIHHLSQ
jgi:cytochrome c-type biogenesis protein CcmH/NrfG